MKICVVGASLEMERLCRAALQSFATPDVELIVSPGHRERPEADAYVWDCGIQPSPSQLSAEIIERSLFVVDPDRLESFRALLGTTPARIVLKPLQPKGLQSFLQHALRPEKREDRSIRREPVPDSTPHANSAGEGEDLFQCLLQANERLRENDQRQAELIAEVSRSFSAPLKILAGYCGLLLDQRPGSLNPEQIELLSRMQGTIRKAQRRADAISELAQPLKSDSDLTAGNLEAALSQAVLEIAPLAEKKDLRITMKLDSPEQPLMFDPVRIQHVFISVLDHACQVPAKSRTIQVIGYSVFWTGASPRASQPVSRLKKGGISSGSSYGYRIDVRDFSSAIGSQPSRMDAPNPAESSGEDVAMALCRTIMRAHQGRIWKELYREATQFSLVFPYRQANDPPGSDDMLDPKYANTNHPKPGSAPAKRSGTAHYGTL